MPEVVSAPVKDKATKMQDLVTRFRCKRDLYNYMVKRRMSFFDKSP